MAERIQQRRAKGWRKPENTVSVARGTKWGNPYKVGGELVLRATECEGFYTLAKQTVRITPSMAVALYREFWLTNKALGDFPYRHYLDIDELRGKNLMCWCPLDQPCHADVLLELANQERGQGT